MNDIDRRQFFKHAGLIGGGVLLATSPWISVFSETNNTQNSVVRIGVIGPGSRGQFLMGFLSKNPKVEIKAICDIYKPSIDKALEIAPKAKVYSDYRQLLEDKEIDAVIVSVPLDRHYKMVIDAFDAGKHVFCEKSMGITMEECYNMYQKYLTSGKIFFVGQQRLFDPRYIKAMEMVHAGIFGEISGIRTFWYRNNDWRRPVPSPEFERLINWRLYKDYSRGLMTELACHQLQIGTWALRQIPNKVMGHGSITFWKDGREVYDNVSCIYIFDNGVKINFDSVISNKFYGLEEQILGSKGTIEPEKGKYYFEETPPKKAFLQMLDNIGNSVFNATSLAGTSWAPETAGKNSGKLLINNRSNLGDNGISLADDGTSLLISAFAEAAITGKQPEQIVEESYYASALTLLGYEAIERGEILTFPDEYKINYLNHSV